MLQQAAKAVRSKGRFGDTELVHVSPRELGYLSASLGVKPTINPDTGLPEFFLGELFGAIAPALASAVGSAVSPGFLGDIGGLFLEEGSPWASTLGGGLFGAGVGALSNAIQGKDLLSGAGWGALQGAAVPSVGKALGFGFDTPFNIPTLFDVNSMINGTNDVLKAGAVQGAGEFGNGLGQAASTGLGSAATTGGATAAATAGKSLLARNPWLPMAAMGLLAAAGGGKQAPATQSVNQSRPSSWVNYQYPGGQKLNRTRRTAASTGPGEYQFFDNNELPDVKVSAARGGALSGAPAEPVSSQSLGYLKGPGDGRSDSILARVSNDEYVIDAETMALLGNGSPAAGALKLDEFRERLRKHKGRALSKGRFSPDAKNVEGYLSMKKAS